MRDYFDKSISGQKGTKQQVHCSDLVISAKKKHRVGK